MWQILNGTIVNAATVTAGSLLGLSVGRRLAERYRSIVLASLGLVTICLGIDAAVLRFADTTKKFAPLVNNSETLGARLAMVMIAALIVGALLGTWLRLHERIEKLGEWIHGRFSGQQGHGFAEGFLTASVIFCVGPLTLLGCIRNGAEGDPSYLYIKSALDGFCSLALASTFGWGVFASILTIIFFQGGLALIASVAAEPLHPLSLDMMTVVGGVVLLATAMMILEIRKLPVANMLPAIFLPPLIIRGVEAASPGMILPLG